jgi:hypothetical protein
MVRSAKSPIGGKGTTNKLSKFISETEIGDSSVENTTVDSIAARDAAISAHNVSAAHGRTNLDGVTERDAAISAHAASAAHSSHGTNIACNTSPPSATTSTYAKMAQWTVSATGLYRCTWGQSGAAGTHYGQIYINGSPAGTEMSGGSGTIFVDFVNATAGDLLQLYCKTSGSNGAVGSIMFQRAVSMTVY